MQPWPLSQGLCGWYVLQCLQGQVTLREPEGRGRPFPGAEAAGSPVSRPLPQGRGSHLFHVVPAGDSGPRDGTLHVESPPSVLSLVSDEPVFLLRPHQRLLKNTGPVGSVPGNDGPPLGSRTWRTVSHGGGRGVRPGDSSGPPCSRGSSLLGHPSRPHGRRGQRGRRQRRRGREGRVWDGHLLPRLPWTLAGKGRRCSLCYFQGEEPSYSLDR